MFDRLRRGMQLTGAGRLLAENAGQIFRLADSAESAVGEFAGPRRGHLMIESSRTIAAYVMPALMDAFRDLYPSVTIELTPTRNR